MKDVWILLAAGPVAVAVSWALAGYPWLRHWTGWRNDGWIRGWHRTLRDEPGVFSSEYRRHWWSSVTYQVTAEDPSGAALVLLRMLKDDSLGR